MCKDLALCPAPYLQVGSSMSGGAVLQMSPLLTLLLHLSLSLNLYKKMIARNGGVVQVLSPQDDLGGKEIRRKN